MRLCPDTYVRIEYDVVERVGSIIIADVQLELKVPVHLMFFKFQLPTSNETQHNPLRPSSNSTQTPRSSQLTQVLWFVLQPLASSSVSSRSVLSIVSLQDPWSTAPRPRR